MKKKISLILIIIITMFFIFETVEAQETNLANIDSSMLQKNALFNSKIQIDSPRPSVTKQNNMRIRGWIMSNLDNRTIEVYIDNKKITFENEKRQDVLDAIKGYNSSLNLKPGYLSYEDNRSLTYGNHQVKVVITDNNTNDKVYKTKSFKIEMPNTQIWIDYPNKTTTKSDNMKIRGWVMSDLKDKKVEVFVDENEVSSSSVIRQDVLDAIKGYGTKEENPKPGFEAYYDNRSLNYGKHNVNIKVYDSITNELIKTASKEFEITTPKTQMWIDNPTASVTKTENMKIKGWVMSDLKNKEIKVFVDGNEVSSSSVIRQDVLDAIKGYGTKEENPKPGFEAYFDNRSLNYGKHKVEVKVYDKDSNSILKTLSKEFEVVKSASRIQIDSPESPIKKEKSMRIRGWVMSELKDKKVEVYVDNTKVESASETRQDVLDAIKGYGTKEENPQPGYVAYYNSRNLTVGKHKITIKVIDGITNELINTSTKTFEIQQVDAKMYIDSPTDITYKKSVFVKGWIMAPNDKKHINVYLDGQLVNNISKVNREDVIAAITGYGGREDNPQPGFEGTIDLTTIKDGKHTLKIDVIDEYTHEVIMTTTKTFTNKKYDCKLYLDYPTGSNFSSDFEVRGWEMSEIDNSTVKFYIDGKETTNVVNRSERPDVISAISGYGGLSMNATPGFNGVIPISPYKEGNHTLTVKVISKVGDEIAKYEKIIFISKSKSYGIDVSSHNTVESWSKVKSYGIDYVILRAGVRGYGTAGNLKEDEKFVTYANAAYNSGLKLGVYVFSQAINENEAVLEADLALRMMAKVGTSKFSMPVVFDTEYSGCTNTNGTRCGRADNLSKQKRTNIAKAYLERIKNAGYKPMIYGSASFLKNNVDMSQLSKYDTWVAHYKNDPEHSLPNYDGPYQIWQYTSEGSVSGIKGNVDRNYVYKRY